MTTATGGIKIAKQKAKPAKGKPKVRTFRAHFHQGQVLKSGARFTAAFAGTGGGKTWIGPIWLANEVMKYPTDTFLIGAPTHKILRNATMPTLIRQWEDTVLAGEYKEQKGHYLLHTGGIIYCLSMDNPYGNEGVHARAGWGDEAGLWSYMAWIVWQARLGQKQGRSLFTTTPAGLNWCYTDLYQRWKGGDPDYNCLTWNSEANPAYPEEEVERARRSMSPAMFAMRYRGQFVRAEGLCHPEFHTCLVDEADLDMAKLIGESCGGMDFGFENPTAIYNCILTRDDILYVMEEFHQTHKVLDDFTRWMKRGAIYGCDPSGAGWIEELNRRGLDARPAETNDPDVRVAALEARIRTGHLKVLRRRCPELIDESETYCFDEKTGKPMKVKDHGMNALQYLCVLLQSRVPITNLQIASDRAAHWSRPSLGRAVL